MNLTVAASKTPVGALDLLVLLDLFVSASGGVAVADLLYTSSDTKTPPLATLFSNRPNKGMDLSHYAVIQCLLKRPRENPRQNPPICLTISPRVQKPLPRQKPIRFAPRFRLQFEGEHHYSLTFHLLSFLLFSNSDS